MSLFTRISRFRTPVIVGGALGISVVGILTFFPPPSTPQVFALNLDMPCNRFNNMRPVPPGYGASYNVFSDEEELVLDPICETNGDLKLLVHGESFETFVSKHGYIWDGARWNPITLKGGVPAPGFVADPVTGFADWYSDSAIFRIRRDEHDDYPATIYFVAYACYRINGELKCGCKDRTCGERLWQLQAVTNSNTFLSQQDL